MEEEDRNALIIKTIEENARKIGYDFGKMSDNDKQYLIKIETVILKIFELEQEARDMISKNTVSIKGVSKKTKIARQTLYNNPMLKEYINYRAEAFAKIDASRKDSAMYDKIKQLKEEITILHKRDVELEEAKRQIKDLKKQLKERDVVIKSFRQSPTGNIFSFHHNKYN